MTWTWTGWPLWLFGLGFTVHFIIFGTYLDDLKKIAQRQAESLERIGKTVDEMASELSALNERTSSSDDAG
jgi:hypothetical protein